MARDIVVGPRCGASGSPSTDPSQIREGAYQFPSIDDNGDIIDLSAWGRDQYITIQWLPGTVGDRLLFGFFATEALADDGFDVSTDSGGGAGIVPNAPGWIDAGSVDVAIPARYPFLRIQSSSSNNGFAVVRSSDGDYAGSDVGR